MQNEGCNAIPRQQMYACIIEPKRGAIGRMGSGLVGQTKWGSGGLNEQTGSTAAQTAVDMCTQKQQPGCRSSKLSQQQAVAAAIALQSNPAGQSLRWPPLASLPGEAGEARALLREEPALLGPLELTLGERGGATLPAGDRARLALPMFAPGCRCALPPPCALLPPLALEAA